MIDELQLLSGNDIPFHEASMIIHPPTIKEIGLIGEETFFAACESLIMLKSTTIQGKMGLMYISEFEILMSIMLDDSPGARQRKLQIMQLLALIFPEYRLEIDTQTLELVFINDDGKHIINKHNFLKLQEILKQIFCMDKFFGKGVDYNPAGARARAIAEKIKQGKQKVAKTKPDQKISILNRYASILAVGMRIPLQTILSYTMYQLYDSFGRFELKSAYDTYLSAKIAGATGMDEAEDWMKDIHSVEADIKN